MKLVFLLLLLFSFLKIARGEERKVLILPFLGTSTIQVTFIEEVIKELLKSELRVNEIKILPYEIGEKLFPDYIKEDLFPKFGREEWKILAQLVNCDIIVAGEFKDSPYFVELGVIYESTRTTSPKSYTYYYSKGTFTPRLLSLSAQKNFYYPKGANIYLSIIFPQVKGETLKSVRYKYKSGITQLFPGISDGLLLGICYPHFIEFSLPLKGKAEVGIKRYTLYLKYNKSRNLAYFLGLHLYHPLLSEDKKNYLISTNIILGGKFKVIPFYAKEELHNIDIVTMLGYLFDLYRWDYSFCTNFELIKGKLYLLGEYRHLYGSSGALRYLLSYGDTATILEVGINKKNKKGPFSLFFEVKLLKGYSR